MVMPNKELPEAFDGLSTAIIHRSEIEYMSRCVLDFPNLETGGDLFGFWTHSGFPVIQYVIGPGPNARRTETTFFQDRQYLVKMGTFLRQQYGLQHIGTFHSHHQLSLSWPSRHDDRTITTAIETYGLKRFLLIICNLRAKHDHPSVNDSEDNLLVSINGFLFRRSHEVNYDKSDWEVLGSPSPIRRIFNIELETMIIKHAKSRTSQFTPSPIEQPAEAKSGEAIQSEKHSVNKEHDSAKPNTIFDLIQRIASELKILVR
jgi:hypothetical protein